MDEQDKIARLMAQWVVRQSDIDKVDIFDKSTWKKDFKVTGFALSQYNIRNRQEGHLVNGPTSTTFERYDGGTRATAGNSGRPCEPAFLNALIRDCERLLYDLVRVHEITTFDKVRVPLPANTVKTMEMLDTVFSQCQRFKVSPELFATREMRKGFLEAMARIAKAVSHLRNAMFIRHVSNVDRQMARKAEKKLAKELPFFHPNRPDGLNPWNRWLNNSAPVMPLGWVGVQQRIPHIGDNIIRRITVMYQLYEKQFEDENLLDLEVNDNTPEFPEPGIPLQHMQWAACSTIGAHYVGFPVGRRQAYDRDNIITVEVLAKFHPGTARNPTVDLDENVPFYRFCYGYEA
uniref:Mating-type protein MAT1-1-5 n=1 Tax=Rutstroemia cuniculi TaxID=1302223 RepID=A0A0G2SLD6_9HELO|nr:mating-type protein MAT1-1-5 [Rutstroemia cuniculi]AJW31355.1 mating-type protein MAT1-1-5 [Rutstroemia cuniculi]